MKFVYPAGLWALAGVLVVAGVYLFRRKYEEKPYPASICGSWPRISASAIAPFSG